MVKTPIGFKDTQFQVILKAEAGNSHTLEQACYKDPLKITALAELEEENAEVSSQLACLEARSTGTARGRQFESLGLSKRELKPLKPSIEEPQFLELKRLPSHL
ncbi:uncharacterized protein LOC21411247 [Morus notabilis]|uniref:uncharacterized protein LOC21411247 n=1 Tax=Morus notabilis TaxID=981085 RepID=UPI000CED1DED|nr:uncharacterized protein LOC21411247 [Morus notabilis]